MVKNLYLGSEACVNMLIDNGANVTFADYLGRTVFHVANQHGNL